MTDNSTLLAVRAIAAKAAMLADDMEHHRTWEGDVTRGLNELTNLLSAAHKTNTDRKY